MNLGMLFAVSIVLLGCAKEVDPSQFAPGTIEWHAASALRQEYRVEYQFEYEIADRPPALAGTVIRSFTDPANWAEIQRYARPYQQETKIVKVREQAFDCVGGLCWPLQERTWTVEELILEHSSVLTVRNEETRSILNEDCACFSFVVAETDIGLLFDSGTLCYGSNSSLPLYSELHATVFDVPTVATLTARSVGAPELRDFEMVLPSSD